MTSEAFTLIYNLSLIHISEPTRRYAISYAVFCLKKNESIEIVASKFNDSIYEVKLLDGFYKGKTYYLIADELEKNFKQEIKDNDSI